MHGSSAVHIGIGEYSKVIVRRGVNHMAGSFRCIRFNGFHTIRQPGTEIVSDLRFRNFTHIGINGRFACKLTEPTDKCCPGLRINTKPCAGADENRQKHCSHPLQRSAALSALTRFLLLQGFKGCHKLVGKLMIGKLILIGQGILPDITGFSGMLIE